jgi:hypothetical protein
MNFIDPTEESIQSDPLSDDLKFIVNSKRSNFRTEIRKKKNQECMNL